MRWALLLTFCATQAAAYALPDKAVTPGAVDPLATTAMVCTKGYATNVRPPRSYIGHLKRKQLRNAPYASKHSLAEFEEDHLVPLELGGAPKDVRNLWPEERKGAAVKDRCENAAHRKVCRGALTLESAQQGFADNWIVFCKGVTQ